jgi:dTDP-4-dehydrorhamnose reductase
VLHSPDGTELAGFDDQHWNGVTTTQFAELCRRIIESGSFDQIRCESGLHHFCPNPPTTKYELLCRVREVTGRSIVVQRARSGIASARILASVYSSLSEIYPERPSWDAAIQDALAWG